MPPSQLKIEKVQELFKNKEYELAQNSAVSIIKNFPDHLLSWKILSVSLAQLGKLDDAVIACKKIVMLDPKDSENYNNYGNIQYDLSEFNFAQENYKKAIKLNPNFAEAYNNLGVVQKKQGKIDAAEDSYKKAIKLKPDYIEANNNLEMIQEEKEKKKN